MSRYTAIKDNIEYAWGYDYMMQEYFVQAEDIGPTAPDPSTIWWIGSHTTIEPHPKYPNKYKYSNGDIMSLIKDEGIPVPEEHLMALGGDLPF